MKKYELIPEGKLFRIKALKDFGDIKKGELGGLVSGEHNLSQEDNCWVYRNAKVIGNARVFEDAIVFGNAIIYGDAQIYDNAMIEGDAQIYDNAMIEGDAQIYDNAVVFGNAEVSGYAKIYGNAQATKKVITFGNAFVYDITITDKHIQIGCEQHLKSEWKNFSDKEILKMEGKKALKFWRLFKPLAEQMNLFD